MFRLFARSIAGVALFAAGMALLACISLFLVGAYATSWPILRLSPRNRKMRALMDLSTAALTAAQVFGLDRRSDDSFDSES